MPSPPFLLPAFFRLPMRALALPRLTPFFGSARIRPSLISVAISCRVIADPTLSLSSGSIHTLLSPAFIRLAAIRRWLRRLTRCPPHLILLSLGALFRYRSEQNSFHWNPR